jgi:uncharacterized phage protein (TIGR02218 family)
MARTLSSSLLTHLTQQVTTLCTCWRIERQDGTVIGFTDLDVPLTIQGVTYNSEGGFGRSAVARDNTLSVNNLELQSYLLASGIAESDLIGGRYDYAQVSVFMVNYLALPTDLAATPNQQINLLSGRLGEAKNNGRGFTAELRSLTDKLEQQIASLTSKDCRYDLGNSRCTVNLASFTFSLSVSVGGIITCVATGTTQVANYFDRGWVQFTSGANNGFKAQVRASGAGPSTFLQFWEAMPYPIVAGDTLTATAGCDKGRDGDCKNKFNNVINFGGEWAGSNFMPGADKIVGGF